MYRLKQKEGARKRKAARLPGSPLRSPLCSVLPRGMGFLSPVLEAALTAVRVSVAPAPCISAILPALLPTIHPLRVSVRLGEDSGGQASLSHGLTTQL